MHFSKLFIVFFVIAALACFTLLELSKNTVWGWLLALSVFAAFFILRGTVLADKSIWLRLAAFALFIAALVGVGKLSAPPARQTPAVSAKEPGVTPVRSTQCGDLTGVFTEDGGVEVYAGIPYAKPPVGELRWKAPEKPEPWSGVRACDTFAPMSMQPRSNVLFDAVSHIVVYNDYKITTKDNWLQAMSEDSLYLNVWKPAGDVSDCPVLVYIHGGSLTTGSAYYRDHSGEAFARQGVVFVSIAYRLGVFGYYAHPDLAAEDPNGSTGNYGLLDQILALEWVRDNIASFGGDPEKVTIAGESAGASCVNALCVSPLAKGLFRYAIAESSGITGKEPYHTFRRYSSALETGSAIMEEFGANSIDELRSVPAEKLVSTRYPNSAMTVDGYAITEQPYLTYENGENNEQALLSGYNMHEADVFVATTKVTRENYLEKLRPVFGDHAEEAAALFPPAERDPEYTYFLDAGGEAKGSFNELYSAAWFDYSHYNWGRLLAAEGRPVYEYFFNKNNGGIGSIHSGEIPYAYGNLPADSRLYGADDYALSDIMTGYWLNFIRTGDPNGEGLPAWQKFNDDPTMVLELNTEVRMVKDKYLGVYDLIDMYMDEESNKR